MEIRICIDVEDLGKALRFYVEGLGLRVGRRFDEKWVELLGASAPIDLLVKAQGSPAAIEPSALRDYRRHWTPLHLDFAVADIEAAIRRAETFGAKLEGSIREEAYGRLALMADPFGHGFCFLEFQHGGYDRLPQKSG